MSEELIWTPIKFVFMGKRRIGNVMYAQIGRLTDKGIIEKTFMFAASKNWSRFAVGGVYEGAELTTSNDSSTIRGHATSKWVAQWPDLQDRIEWRAHEDAAEDAERNARFEADQRKTSEVEEILLPIRERYEALRRKYDYAGVYALEQAVLRALRASPRKKEKT